MKIRGNLQEWSLLYILAMKIIIYKLQLTLTHLVGADFQFSHFANTKNDLQKKIHYNP
jgi:hypothetical protein